MVSAAMFGTPARGAAVAEGLAIPIVSSAAGSITYIFIFVFSLSLLERSRHYVRSGDRPTVVDRIEAPFAPSDKQSAENLGSRYLRTYRSRHVQTSLNRGLS